MFKPFRDAPPVVNVVAGQTATLDLDVGWRYHAIRIISTVTKNAGAATEPTLDEAIGQITVNVNGDPKRTHLLASHLNAIQTKWSDRISATLYSKVANDLVTATIDGAVGGNVQRTSTWVLDIWLSEPSRDSYQARQAFAWPTQWNNKAVGNFPANYTADIQVQLGVPTSASISGTAMRAEMMVDNIAGSLVAAAGGTAPGQIGTDILALAGITAPAVGSPCMPVTHFYTFPEDYSSTALAIRKWPFTGGTIQELDLFCQAGDDVASFVVLTDNTIKRKTSKNSNDMMNLGWGWNRNYGNGTAGINFVAADLLSLAFDQDDDPGSALSTATFNTLELDLTLTQAAAGNKSITFVAQVYRNALLV
jgi:hypothetical protein